MAYTLVIGTKNWSSWSLRAWLALRATGAPFRETVLKLRSSGATALIREYSPSARVPVLRIGEGDAALTVFDSLAICETLAERHPQAGLWPQDPDTRALARAYAAEMHSGFLALRETLPMDFARRLPAPPLNDTVRGEISRIRTAWQTALDRHGREGGFLFGRFSIADCMYAPVVSRFLTYGIDLPEDLAAYAGRMMALPAMRDWHDAARQEIAGGLPDQWTVPMTRNTR